MLRRTVCNCTIQGKGKIRQTIQKKKIQEFRLEREHNFLEGKKKHLYFSYL